MNYKILLMFFWRPRVISNDRPGGSFVNAFFIISSLYVHYELIKRIFKKTEFVEVFCNPLKNFFCKKFGNF